MIEIASVKLISITPYVKYWQRCLETKLEGGGKLTCPILWFSLQCCMEVKNGPTKLNEHKLQNNGMNILKRITWYTEKDSIRIHNMDWVECNTIRRKCTDIYRHLLKVQRYNTNWEGLLSRKPHTKNAVLI